MYEVPMHEQYICLTCVGNIRGYVAAYRQIQERKSDGCPHIWVTVIHYVR